jgi:hypothetical protein
MRRIAMLKGHRDSFAASLLILCAALVLLLAGLQTACAQRQVVVRRAGGGDPIDEAAKAAVVDSLTNALDDIYVFPDIAQKMVKTIKSNLRKGRYKDAATGGEFAGMLTEDMFEIAHDRHLHIDYMPEPPRFAFRDTLTEEDEQGIFDILAADNFGFYRLERLPGNIGYLDLRGFNDTRWAGRTAVAAMNFLAYCDAIIIDLRRNGGGSPSMIQLISSYFFDDPVHLNDFYIRATDKTKQFWSQTYVEGPKMADTDLYILTSSYTFSAAEEFTYNMKNLERATIIGETTGGGAHPVELHAWPDLKMSLSVPFGRAVNPISGTNWEGTGIEPHIQVPEGEALEVAHLTALEKLAEKAGEGPEQAQLLWDIDRLKAMTNQVEIDTDTMRKYAGNYGARKLTLENGALYYQRNQGPKMKMIPMTGTTFMFEEIDGFKLEIELNGAGNPVAALGHYREGRIDRTERD